MDVFSEVFLEDSAAKRTHNLLLTPKLCEQCVLPFQHLRKTSPFSTSRKHLGIEVYSLVQKCLSFRHAHILLPVIRFLQTAAYFKFIFSIFFISLVLIPTICLQATNSIQKQQHYFARNSTYQVFLSNTNNLQKVWTPLSSQLWIK